MSKNAKTWDLRLMEAHARKIRGLKPFTESDVARAHSWFACAVGERGGEEVASKMADFGAGLEDISEPEKELFRLGTRFNTAVQVQDVDGARGLYRQILDQVAVIREGN